MRQNVLDMTLHIAQYSNIITDLRDEIRRLRQKPDQQQTLPGKHGVMTGDINDAIANTFQLLYVYGL